MLTVELVYVAEDGRCVQLSLSLKPGSTVRDALNDSGIYDTHPETRTLPVGIYAKQVTGDTVLKEGDRVEIYRALTRDPKEKRRQLARLRKKSIAAMKQK